MATTAAAPAEKKSDAVRTKLEELDAEIRELQRVQSQDKDTLEGLRADYAMRCRALASGIPDPNPDQVAADIAALEQKILGRAQLMAEKNTASEPLGKKYNALLQQEAAEKQAEEDAKLDEEVAENARELERVGAQMNELRNRQYMLNQMLSNRSYRKTQALIEARQYGRTA